MLKKIREFLFPRWLKHYGHFLSFKLPRKIINIERISFFTQNFWALLEKILMLEIFRYFRNFGNFGKKLTFKNSQGN
jgi:hypothetical protein